MTKDIKLCLGNIIYPFSPVRMSPLSPLQCQCEQALPLPVWSGTRQQPVAFKHVLCSVRCHGKIAGFGEGVSEAPCYASPLHILQNIRRDKSQPLTEKDVENTRAKRQGQKRELHRTKTVSFCVPPCFVFVSFARFFIMFDV